MGAPWSSVSPCRPCAGAGLAGPAFASHWPVKAEGIERGFERRRVPSTGCQQPGDNPAHGHVGSSSTEGTSGAAEPAPLRGGTGEAALGSSSRIGRGSGSIRARRRRACARNANAQAGVGRAGHAARGPAGPAQAGPARWDRRGSSRMSHMLGALWAAPGSPAGVATVPRQEVPEWTGLGRSSCCARSSEPLHGRRRPPLADGP